MGNVAVSKNSEAKESLVFVSLMVAQDATPARLVSRAVDVKIAHQHRLNPPDTVSLGRLQQSTDFQYEQQCVILVPLCCLVFGVYISTVAGGHSV